MRRRHSQNTGKTDQILKEVTTYLSFFSFPNSPFLEICRGCFVQNKQLNEQFLISSAVFVEIPEQLRKFPSNHRFEMTLDFRGQIVPVVTLPTREKKRRGNSKCGEKEDLMEHCLVTRQENKLTCRVIRYPGWSLSALFVNKEFQNYAFYFHEQQSNTS